MFTETATLAKSKKARTQNKQISKNNLRDRDGGTGTTTELQSASSAKADAIVFSMTTPDNDAGNPATAAATPATGGGGGPTRAAETAPGDSPSPPPSFAVREVGNQATWSLSSCKPGKAQRPTQAQKRKLAACINTKQHLF